MNYKYPGALAEFFRCNHNTWAIKAEIVRALGGTDAAQKMFTRYRTGGQLEKRYDRATQLMQYRLLPDGLYQTVEAKVQTEKTRAASRVSDAKAKGRVESLSSEFCARFGVREPYQATQRDPQALRIWCEMLARI